MKITGAEAIMKSLIHEGVKIVFGYPGGAIMPTYDAIYKYKDRIKHVLVRHEQGASHSAEGYAIVSGKPGVVIATSGPGATNLITGIADAMMDSIPLICITGQVADILVGTDAFQEVDVIGITTPITKWNHQITKASEVPEIIACAFHIATTGRPGPVVIDITKNAQFDEFEWYYPEKVELESFQPTLIPNAKQIKLAGDLINKAERPYMLVGHGVLIAQAEKELLEFVEKSDIPVATTLLGKSAIPCDHSHNVGWLGMHGNLGPNILTNKADVILAIGMRFDDRVTGRLSDYAKQAKIIHIDIDPAELNKNVKVEIPIVGDAKIALCELTKHIEKKSHSTWRDEFHTFYEQEKEKVINAETKPTNGKIKMAEAIHVLSELTKGEAIIVTDVGQHQMKTSQHYFFKHPRTFVTSGGAGTMGYGVPAAIGAKFAFPNKQVIAIVGDGGFQMTIQELGTILQEKLPVKIVILNNNFLGMVRQWQHMFFDERYSYVDLINPDFVKVANAYDIKAEKVEHREDLKSAFIRMLDSKDAYIVNIIVEQKENVFPMMPAGASVEEIRTE
ncbi:MAG: biosynthetic-type acetolactate synthase large subunit [Candidatus Roizmanbacteria bacterium]